jgi:hypothetical protein
VCIDLIDLTNRSRFSKFKPLCAASSRRKAPRVTEVQRPGCKPELRFEASLELINGNVAMEVGGECSNGIRVFGIRSSRWPLINSAIADCVNITAAWPRQPQSEPHSERFFFLAKVLFTFRNAIRVGLSLLFIPLGLLPELVFPSHNISPYFYCLFGATLLYFDLVLFASFASIAVHG